MGSRLQQGIYLETYHFELRFYYTASYFIRFFTPPSLEILVSHVHEFPKDHFEL